jgi:sugar (pentulose or hexulose) kinase
MRYLGLDIGSSFFKGAVLDPDAGTLSHISREDAPLPVGGLDPAFREFDAEAVLERVRVLLERLHATAPDAAGVLMCSQLHGVLLCDVAARPLSRFISWQDQRALQSLGGAGTTCEEEIDRLVGETDRRELGNERVPGMPLNNLYWMKRRGMLPEPPAGRPLVATLPYFIAARLGGGELVADVTNAYGLGALDIRTLDWHRSVIERLGLDGLRWPRVVPQGSVVGEWRAGGKALPIYAPVGDYHCAQAGALLEADELSVNISTGSAVARMADGAETGDFQTRPWFDGRYLKTITHIPGGRALHSLVRLFSELAAAQGVTLDDPWPYIVSQAARADGGGLQIDPAFYASSMGRCGAARDLREENMTVGHVFHAAFAGMADNYAKAAERLAPQRDWKRVVFSGGVARKTDVLRQLICGRLGSAHRFAPSEEDTLFGLLVLASAFTGRTASVHAAMEAFRAPRSGAGAAASDFSPLTSICS